MKKIAAIFDMDGTLIDNNDFHYRSWKIAFEQHKLPQLTRTDFNKKMSGVPGLASLKNILGQRNDEDFLTQLFADKSEIYKREYAPHIAPINGLENFLEDLKQADVKMAVATSASPGNVKFAFDHLTIGPYFDAFIDGSALAHPKPNPQIFLNAARALQTEPQHCVVFEDSIAGVQAGVNAGMKVVAITTTHHADELPGAALVINDYAEINFNKVLALFN